jgi:predicted dehydrogenase
MNPLRVGIIGYGRIGAEHAEWLLSASNARATAVADATPARRELAERRGLKAFENIDSLLADPSIDAVLVASPTAMHFEHASRAIEAGKHLMVEKPMALDLAQSLSLREQARSRNVTLSVFHNRRWDVDYLTVQDAIASGTFGKLINIESRLGQFSSCVGPAAKEYRPNWRNEASFGGGGLYDWGSHFVDQIWRLLLPARPVRVFAQLRANVWSSDCDDFARVLIDFDNGVAGLVEINTTTTAPLPRWHIDGALGSAFSPPSPAFDTRVWADLRFTPVEGEPRTFPLATAGLDEPKIWEAFANAVSGNGEPAVTIDSVLPTMALLDAARESGRTGQAVTLNQNIY